MLRITTTTTKMPKIHWLNEIRMEAEKKSYLRDTASHGRLCNVIKRA